MSTVVLAQADALQMPLPDNSVDCHVTSPPYFGLRRYAGLPPTSWPAGHYSPVPGTVPLDMPAWEGCLGEEPVVSWYVWHLVLVLREMKRTLKPSGIAWIVIGDCYSSGDRHGHGTRVGDKPTTNRGMNGTDDPQRPPQPVGYPQGSLLGIPAQVMMAAMADDWTVRNDCVWSKAACMPESVQGTRWQHKQCSCVMPQRVLTGQQKAQHAGPGHREHSGGVAAFPATVADPDCPHCGGTGHLDDVVLRRGSWRHTRSHETILMLTKSMGYWADSLAVREEAVMKPQRRTNGHSLCTYDPPGRQAPSRGDRGVKEEPGIDGPGGRNPRSVLTPKAGGTDVEHYATFPASLLIPFVKASCPARCCAVCGSGFAPLVTTTGGRAWHQDRMKANGYPGQLNGANGYKRGQSHEPLNDTQCQTVHGYAPTCACVTDLPPQPGLVVDCFAGSGTTVAVARALGRRAIGLELSPTYTRLARTALGLAALADWEGRKGPIPPETFTDLPLFAGS